MSVVSVLNELRSRLRRRKAERVTSNWGRYCEILADIGADKPIDYDELEVVMEALGVSQDNLNADVKWKQEHSLQHARASQVGRHQAAMQATQQQLDALISERGRVLQEYDTKALALQQQVRQHESEAIIAESAKTWLLNNCRDPEVLEREPQVHAELARLHAVEQDLLLEKQPFDVRAEYVRRQIEANRSGNVDKLKQELGVIEQDMAELNNRIAALRPRQDALRQEREQLAKLKLVP